MHHLFSVELNMLNYAFTFPFMSSTYMPVVDFGHYLPQNSQLRLIHESTYTRVYTVAVGLKRTGCFGYFCHKASCLFMLPFGFWNLELCNLKICFISVWEGLIQA